MLIKFPILVIIFPKGSAYMTDTQYISTKEAAELLGLSTRRVVGLCNNNSLEGAVHEGRNWKIPKDSVIRYGGLTVNDASGKKPLFQNIRREPGEDIPRFIFISDGHIVHLIVCISFLSGHKVDHSTSVINGC